MNKEIMLSIQPKHLVNILNGNKTLELRKSVPKDFKGWVNLYVTNPKKKPFLNCWYGNCYLVNDYTYEELINDNSIPLNGKVAARFWFDEYEEIKERFNGDEYIIEKLDELCLSDYEVKEYLGNKKGYAWHIKQLEIFDEPLSLSDFYKATLYASGQVIKEYEKQTNDFSYRLQRPPQSYQFVYRKAE